MNVMSVTSLLVTRAVLVQRWHRPPRPRLLLPQFFQSGFTVWCLQLYRKLCFRIRGKL